ncbi:hypothetical protein CR159_19220 [Pollutimonas subterranea]|uniref:Uncharacterized protein n=1 Tax=Pollutimonas subterranea TaxID=2045210 RepID=A0A2N4TZL8_9BURK|nr:hypothetical protein [Pollutimonas subterranea]PLC48207.1 hypothetical protein CR159_19220 [Pollutimonas subterranea]
MNTDKAGDTSPEVKGDIKEAAGITSGQDRDPGGKAEKGQRPSPHKDEDSEDDIVDMPEE